MNKQIETWQGDFGNAYIERNLPSDQRIEDRKRAFTEILSHAKGGEPVSVLECGCNIGLNLRALKHITPAALYACEPNDRARERLLQDDVIPATRLTDGTLQSLPYEANSFDLVFTSGVLIHVHPDQLEAAYHEMYRVSSRYVLSIDRTYRVSSRYVLSIEYFSKHPETIRYQGRDDLLFKRDFGGMWLDLYPTLKPVANGFFWQRTSGLDDVTWWLFEK